MSREQTLALIVLGAAGWTARQLGDAMAGKDASTSSTVELTCRMDGYLVTQLLYVAARLGIADVLADGPLNADSIAARLGVKAEPLRRVCVAWL